MLWIYLIVLQILFFIGLLYFLRSVLTKNISKATGRLEELGKEYVAKEEAASQLVEKAQKESKGIVARETQVGEDTKERLMQEAQEAREQILKEANKRGLEITEKAERNAEFFRKEIDEKVDERAKEKVLALIQETIPEGFLEDIHKRWVDEFGKGDLDLKHLKLPEKAKDVGIVSAFPLTDQQQNDLKEKFKKKMGAGVILKSEVDPSLIVGIIVTISSVIIDASLKYKIKKGMQE